MLLNFLIGLALIAGSLMVPLVVIAFLAGRSAASHKQYVSGFTEIRQVPQPISETLRSLPVHQLRASRERDREALPLTKAS